MENVVGEDEVSKKTASLEKKEIQSMKLFFIWKFPHAFDHVSRQALYALHQGDVSLKVRWRRLLTVLQDWPHKNQAQRSKVFEPQ